jgi:hypothetical protein
MSKTFEQAREEIARLCACFATNRQAFLAPGVNKAHVRQTLVNPLFEALGWDVRNQGMAAPQYREVVPEESLDVEGRRKAPDYTFRVGTLTRFFAEAKKCSVDIGEDPAPAYQLRRYGWSAKLRLSILTNFVELGVYDCTLRPRPSDKAGHARIQRFRAEEYQCLLDHCLKWYAENNPKRHKKAVYRGRGQNDWRLTVHEKKRILTTHVFGVDIDPQAVEVTKLSLLLKVLEGETDQSLHLGLLPFSDRALPNLAENIKRGNSLVGPEYFAGRLVPDDDEIERVAPFDWAREFSAALAAGGFDCVLGNPPYLYSAGQERADYFGTHYVLGEYQTDYYVYFIERALQLCRAGGRHSFIVTDAWLNSQYFSKLRNHLLASHRISGLAIFSYPVFKNAAIENSIYAVEKGGRPAPFPVVLFASPQQRSRINTLRPAECVKRGMIDPRQTRDAGAILRRMERNSLRLDAQVRINRGIHAYRTDGYGQSKFGPGPQTERDKNEKSYHAARPLNKTYLPELRGKQVFRFRHAVPTEYLSYGEWLAEPRAPEFFYQPKIVVRKVLGRKLSGAFLATPVAVDQSLYILISRTDNVPELKAVLGILLSRIGAWYLRTKHAIYDVLYPWYTKDQLAAFPIPKVPVSDETAIAAVVDQLSALYDRVALATSETQRTAIQRQIDAAENELDLLVYNLYGLTEKDTAVVEAEDHPDLRSRP